MVGHLDNGHNVMLAKGIPGVYYFAAQIFDDWANGLLSVLGLVEQRLPSLGSVASLN